MPETSIEFDTNRLIQAEKSALDYLLSKQKQTGDFEGEMVWCTMILAQAVIVRTIMGRPYDTKDRSQILRHFEVTQASDGSWGMHPESPGYVFFTTLAYVALRLLGVSQMMLLRLAQESGFMRSRSVLRAFRLGVNSGLLSSASMNTEALTPFPLNSSCFPNGSPFTPAAFTLTPA